MTNKTFTFTYKNPSPSEWITAPEVSEDQFIRAHHPELFEVLDSINIPHAVSSTGGFPIATVTITMAENDYISFKLAGGDEWITDEFDTNPPPPKRRVTGIGPTPEESAARITEVLAKARAWTVHPDNEVSRAHNERALRLQAEARQ